MSTNEPNAALSAALKGRARARVLGLTFDDVMRYFFGGNATVAVVVLLLILVFLGKEGAGFFGQNQVNLSVYRKAGLEYVDLMRGPMEEFTGLTRGLNDARLKRFEALLASGKDAEQANDALKDLDAFADQFSASAGDARGLMSDLTEVVSAVKVRAQVAADKVKQQQQQREEQEMVPPTNHQRRRRSQLSPPPPPQPQPRRPPCSRSTPSRGTRPRSPPSSPRSTPSSRRSRVRSSTRGTSG